MQTTKSIARKLHDPGFTTKYFAGVSLDIGSGLDPAVKFKSLFPKSMSLAVGIKNKVMQLIPSSARINRLGPWMRIRLIIATGLEGHGH